MLCRHRRLRDLRRLFIDQLCCLCSLSFCSFDDLSFDFRQFRRLRLSLFRRFRLHRLLFQLIFKFNFLLRNSFVLTYR